MSRLIDFVNKGNKESGYGDSKLINDCPFYQYETNNFIGNCNMNHLAPCTLKLKETYLACSIYKQYFLQKNNKKNTLDLKDNFTKCLIKCPIYNITFQKVITSFQKKIKND